jgi:hypothetical protein
MTDLTTYYTELNGDKPKLLDSSDLRNWTPECSCKVCKEDKSGIGKKRDVLFYGYNHVTLEAYTELTTHQYLLCPFTIQGFVFATRSWGN